MKALKMFALAAIVVCQVVPSSVMAAMQLGLAPEMNSEGRIDGASASLKIPMNFSGRKIAEPAREPVLMAANTAVQTPRQHRVIENSPYDHAKFFTQAMGNVRGYTSKEEFLSALESGETNATSAQYRESLKGIGINLLDDSILASYIAGLEWVSNSNAFNARMGRLLVDRNTSMKNLDGGFVRGVEANEFVLVDNSMVPPRPIIAGDCGNVILAVVGANSVPAAVVAPPPPAPAPQPEVRSVFIAPTAVQPLPASVRSMNLNLPVGYGQFERNVVLVDPPHNHRVRNTVIIVVAVVVVAGVVYALTRKDDGDVTIINNTTNTTTNPPVEPPPVHPVEPPL